MVLLDDVVAYLDRELKTASIPDYPGAVNGLQLANRGKIERVTAAVDASLPVIEAVAAQGGGLLIVHHGMFWQGVQPVKGAFYQKLKIAMEADLAIYSSHLPLDIHPEWGNNIQLARAIGLQNATPFLEHQGNAMGLRGDWQGSRETLLEVLKGFLGGPAHHCPGGPELISKIGIITGGAGSEIAKVAATGVDTFITGEGPHWSFPLAQELRVNLIYGGHYATETSGVRALAEALGIHFSLPWTFSDHPTGL
jgi:dinuclear metal center YbgI/SA1388 family protein